MVIYINSHYNNFNEYEYEINQLKDINDDVHITHTFSITGLGRYTTSYKKHMYFNYVKDNIKYICDNFDYITSLRLLKNNSFHDRYIYHNIKLTKNRFNQIHKMIELDKNNNDDINVDKFNILEKIFNNENKRYFRFRSIELAVENNYIELITPFFKELKFHQEIKYSFKHNIKQCLSTSLIKYMINSNNNNYINNYYNKIKIKMFNKL